MADFGRTGLLSLTWRATIQISIFGQAGLWQSEHSITYMPRYVAAALIQSPSQHNAHCRYCDNLLNLSLIVSKSLENRWKSKNGLTLRTDIIWQQLSPLMNRMFVSSHVHKSTEMTHRLNYPISQHSYF